MITLRPAPMPATPSAGNSIMINMPLAGPYPLLRLIDDQGRVQTFDAAAFGDRVARYTPRTNAAGMGIQNGMGARWTPTNTAAPRYPIVGGSRAEGHLGTMISSGIGDNVSSGMLLRANTDPDAGVVCPARGFFFEAIFQLLDATAADTQIWVGPYGQPLLIQDVALSAPNKVGFGTTHLQGATNWFLHYAAEAGNATPIDTGMALDPNVDMRVRVYAMAGLPWIGAEMTNLETADTFSTVLSTDIPSLVRLILEVVHGAALSGVEVRNVIKSLYCRWS